MDWTMYRQDVMSEAPCLTPSVIVDRFEHTHWAAVFTAECGFSSAARLKRLFPFPFPARVEDVIGRENDDLEAFSRQGSQLRQCRARISTKTRLS